MRRPPAMVPPPPPTPRPVSAAPAPQKPSSPPARRPRPYAQASVSRLAVLGAAWAGLFFVMLILSVVRAAAQPPHPDVRPPLWHAIFDYFVEPFGWMAPIGSTVLGLLAIGAIRRSEGAKYGLSLALFDALLFPLLLADVLVWWLCRQGVAALIRQDVMSPAAADAILGQVVPILIVILGDYYVATRAWAAIQPEPA